MKCEPENTSGLTATSARIVLGVAALFVSMAAPCFGQLLATARAEEVGMSSARLGRIRTAMQRYVDKGEVAGVVTLVARNGRVVHFDAVGYRDAASRTVMTTDTIFRIASMTKPVTSVAAMMLFEEGHFLLSDPISKFLPEFSEMKVVQPAPPNERLGVPYKLVPAARPITIRHLLTHTAGLANAYRGYTQAEYRNAESRQRPDETMADVLLRLSKLPLNFHPGDAWEYGPATNVMGRLVEVISGQPLDEFFRDRIFKPLKMSDTHFYLPKSKLPRFSSTYHPGEGGKIRLAEAADLESRYVKEPHVFFSGSGGLVSTAADYLRFLQMMLNGGELGGVRLLGPKTVELMTSNHTGDLPLWLTGPGYGFGLGYSVMREVGQAGLPGSVGQYGWGGAFCTYFWVDAAEGVIGILMAQVRPYDHLNIRHEFQVLANQAIIETMNGPRNPRH